MNPATEPIHAAWRDITLLLAYCALIFFLSGRPVVAEPDLFPNEDKLIHACAYALMAWLAWRSFAHRIGHPALLAVTAFLFASLYGIGDEWHQSFVPQRDADAWDWVADNVGGMCAALTLYLYRRTTEKTGR